METVIKLERGNKTMKRLTEAQKKTIKEMRESGLGYKSIANRLQLSRDTVRSYCVRSIATKAGDVGFKIW